MPESSKFLAKGKDYFFENLESFSMEEMSNILISYSIIEENQKLMEKAEEHILNHARELTHVDCFHMMKAFQKYECSEELWTLFDMVIGKNIRKVHKDEVIPILKMMAESKYKRDKLFILFQHKIKVSYGCI